MSNDGSGVAEMRGSEAECEDPGHPSVFIGRGGRSRPFVAARRVELRYWEQGNDGVGPGLLPVLVRVAIGKVPGSAVASSRDSYRPKRIVRRERA